MVAQLAHNQCVACSNHASATNSRLAQKVEHSTDNRAGTGSTPVTATIHASSSVGRMPVLQTGGREFNSHLAYQDRQWANGRSPAFQAGICRFDSDLAVQITKNTGLWAGSSIGRADDS